MNCSDNEVGDASGLGDEGKNGDIVFVVVTVLRLMVAYNTGCSAARRKWRRRHTKPVLLIGNSNFGYQKNLLRGVGI